MKTKGNFTEGKIFTPMLIFVLPIILTNVLQTAYNVADNVIVGKFSGDTLALAAVGTSGSISALFLNIVVGLSVGASVVVAHSYGAKKEEDVSKGVHTALSFGLIFGLVLGIFAFIFAREILILSGTPENILDKATLYLRIIFAALPATSVYNFAAASLRAVGDSKTSLYILTASGLLNVLLNVFFVCVFGMSVDGVALATAISKYVSAIAVIIVLFKRRGECYAFSFRKLKITGLLLKKMLRMGLPNSIQNSMFSISNVIITSAINTLPTHVISARTIGMNVTNIANNISSSYTNAMLTFSGQNYGARRYERIKKSLIICILQSAVFTLAITSACLVFIRPISDLYISASDVARSAIIEEVRSICSITLPYYFVCSIMNALSGTIRGIGYSMSPMFISVVGICGLRTVWRYTAFNHELFHSAKGLYFSYPLTWTVVSIAFLILLAIAWKRLPKKS